MALTALLPIIETVAGKLGALQKGTLTAAAVGSLTAANYPFKTNRSNASARDYEGAEILITKAATTTAPNPNSVGVYVPATGVLDPAADYTTAPGATDTFDLFLKGITRALLVRNVNNALRNLRYISVYPISLITDADMELSATTWTASVSTLSKVTNESRLQRGNRALKVLNAGHARSNQIPVDPTNQHQYYILARVRADIGTARLEAYDATNSASIKSEDWTSRGPGQLDFTFNLPTTCELLEIRLGSVGANDDTYWDDIHLFETGTREVLLPSHVEVKSMFRKLIADAGGRDAYNRNIYREVTARIVEDTINPNNQIRVTLDRGMSRPHWVVASRRFDTLSADTDTTPCEQEWIEQVALTETLKELAAGAVGQATEHWKEMLAAEIPLTRAWNLARMPGPIADMDFESPPRVPIPLTYP